MAAQDLWDAIENDPDHSPGLWRNIRYKNGIKIIEENASAEEAFSYGEIGWWEEELWESLMDGNVYTPASAPTAWRRYEQETASGA